VGDTSTWNILTTLIAGVATLAIFSFIISENRFYRFFEHLFIGIAAGLSPVLSVRDFLWPKILAPMLGSETIVFPDGTVDHPYQPANLLFIVPMIFGCLYYFIYSRRHGWLAKIVIGFILGASGGLAVKGFFAEVIPQLASSFKPLVVYTQGALDLAESFNNTLFVVTLLLTLNYFFFTFGKAGSLQGRIAPWGRPLLMVCFGAFFGSTVMARLALLVERVQFLVLDWFGMIASMVGFG